MPRTHLASPSKTSFVTSPPARGPRSASRWTSHACLRERHGPFPVYCWKHVIACVVLVQSSNATHLHSLHLYGLRTVVISSVNVYGCDRPIRLENIGYLHINNSTFDCRDFGDVESLNVDIFLQLTSFRAANTARRHTVCGVVYCIDIARNWSAIVAYAVLGTTEMQTPDNSGLHTTSAYQSVYVSLPYTDSCNVSAYV